jgi:hypothetical protein
MLLESEIRERLVYCFCVFRQLNWLYGNSAIPPVKYMKYLKRSSLKLSSDRFITSTLKEAAQLEDIERGLYSIITFYEGIVHALCTVMETDLEEVERNLSPGLLKRLASEMDMQIT